MSPWYSIAAMWLCFSRVLVHNNKCVEKTVLVLTYTNNSAAKNSRLGGGRGQGFRISPSVVHIAVTFFVCARLKRQKFVRKNILYANLCQLAPTESTSIEHSNDI